MRRYGVVRGVNAVKGKGRARAFKRGGLPSHASAAEACRWSNRVSLNPTFNSATHSSKSTEDERTLKYAAEQ